MNKFLPLIVLSLPLLSACTLAPDYERPNAPLPARWPSGAAYSEVNISVKGDVDLAALGWRVLLFVGRDAKLTRAGAGKQSRSA